MDWFNCYVCIKSGVEALKQTGPVPVNFELIEGEAKGYYHKTENRIAIQDGMSQPQTIKTLIHEMAHEKLHVVTDQPMKVAVKSRNS